ncbi:transglycosylase [Romboutsia weinsteinii]|uniref:Penicillin-binding protein 1A n=1 Tax=Romboutsia weinsteinii TaxID=2020949 RepID=A0A371IYY0_9FIRM|nr:biosynthetic peptidoglycan transglycosylase [Romboutsia weinsteinii]RDY25684.1 transglycosylase [Romboutsia weinsteinii]
MSNYNNDENKIRRRKVSSNNLTSQSMPSENVNIKKNDVNTIKRDRTSNIKENKAISSRAKKKKERKKAMMIKATKSLLVVMLIALIVVSAAGSVLVFSVTAGSPKVTKELLESKYISTEVVSKEEIPTNLKNAIVAIEDERFYKHKGVDVISLARSLAHNILSDSTQGGSTIEMQLSKNLLTDDDKNMKRKIQDMYNALQMDKNMSKDDILAAYLNNIYLGKSSYGVATGAKTYFGKDVSDLSLAQCAMLVGITNNPARYMEHSQAKKRQETVLFKMHELGYITDEEYRLALKEDVPFVSEIG